MSELADIHEKLNVLTRLAYNGPSGAEVSNAAKQTAIAWAKLVELQRIGDLNDFAKDRTSVIIRHIANATNELEKIHGKN